ncbi:hypothetical protein QBC47DRAFT_408009 [Echria macrotheca]|uniref:Uncharacterized protein n=1 Tax=Echria macrotheca TaxID=438768 RepID=A0AAJ0B0I2_9PEZI|nr:hypothetical protein QBC47DRAFT_408009 [Echria macrotheca]
MAPASHTGSLISHRAAADIRAKPLHQRTQLENDVLRDYYQAYPDERQRDTAMLRQAQPPASNKTLTSAAAIRMLLHEGVISPISDQLLPRMPGQLPSWEPLSPGGQHRLDEAMAKSAGRWRHGRAQCLPIVPEPPARRTSGLPQQNTTDERRRTLQEIHDDREQTNIELSRRIQEQREHMEKALECDFVMRELYWKLASLDQEEEHVVDERAN